MRHEILKDFIRLDERTGLIYWLPRKAGDFNGRNPQKSCNTWNTRFAQKEAFTAITANGYKHGFIFGKNLYAHQVVFWLFYGYMPKYVDHENGIRTDNRPFNLRPATASENNSNRISKKCSSSKYLGVSWNGQAGRWHAKISKNGRQKHIGLFVCENAAAEAYNVESIRIHGAFARLNIIALDFDKVDASNKEVC